MFQLTGRWPATGEKSASSSGTPSGKRWSIVGQHLEPRALVGPATTRAQRPGIPRARPSVRAPAGPRSRCAKERDRRRQPQRALAQRGARAEAAASPRYDRPRRLSRRPRAGPSRRGGSPRMAGEEARVDPEPRPSMRSIQIIAERGPVPVGAGLERLERHALDARQHAPDVGRAVARQRRDREAAKYPPIAVVTPW